MKIRLALALALIVPCCLLAGDIPEDWMTVAEKTDFRATSSYDETMAYLQKAEAAAPDLIRVTDFGRTGQGRPLPLVIVSSDGAFTPEAAAATGKPILLLQSCIHAGEVDGKNATLMILRDMLADDTVRLEWTKALEDPDFAGNRRARYLWWYQRTPYWDETVGLLPVMRVMAAADLQTESRP